MGAVQRDVQREVNQLTEALSAMRGGWKWVVGLGGPGGALIPTVLWYALKAAGVDPDKSQSLAYLSGAIARSWSRPITPPPVARCTSRGGSSSCGRKSTPCWRSCSLHFPDLKAAGSTI